MPRGDRTGPAGMGPMTGRSAGFCAGNNNPGYMTQAGGREFYGRGFGRGMGQGYGRSFGRGRGYGRGFIPAYPDYNAPYPIQHQAEDEKAFLENELNILKENMQQIEARLNEINKPNKQ